MSSTYGNNLRISIFGQSHSEAIGVVIDGIPAGERFDMDEVQRFMTRRAPGGRSFSTERKEADVPQIQSGLLPEQDGSENEPAYYVSCGAPVCALIKNSDTRSKDYGNLLDLPRPSHADYPAFVKYKGFHDLRGGGHFSGRLTAPLCFAGALCLQMLRRRGIEIGAHIASVADIRDEAYDPVRVSKTMLHLAGSRCFPTNSTEAGEAMLRRIEKAKSCADSVGGVVECGAVGLPCGLGEPMFDGLENKIAGIVFGIPAVKGIEFGDGFASSERCGSENNDAFDIKDGRIVTDTNHAGGILGGISTGMPVIFRAAFKPTASIAKPQKSVSLSRGRQEELIIHGRHDPCIVPRAVPCVEAAAAIAIYDLLRDAQSEGMTLREIQS